MIRKATLLLVMVLATAAAADSPPAPPPINIHRTEGAIQVDGDLSDAGWKNAAAIDQFYETTPGDNIPAKIKTVAYLTYDEKYFYIGIRADDPHPERIRAPYVDRDQVIGTDDNIAVFIDTRNDKRTAIELRVNPRGIQGDYVFNDANGSEDQSPDFFYDTAAKIVSTGWNAEFRIPFTSLRYPHVDPQAWNILVWRNYPREFRYGFFSAPMPRDSNCFVCHVHPVAGLTGLPEAGHFVAAPYVTAQSTQRPVGQAGTRLEREPLHKDAGIDVKWTPTANNAVDFTINPDFSQIEADVAQITVNQRFAVFFPEKRPFFLEGFDLFDTPFQVAYTRTVTDPRFGVRSTGKIGKSTYTLLVADDQGGGLTIIPGPLGSNFARQDFKARDVIGRVRRDFGQSFVGAVLTDREIRGGGFNRVIGPDFQWRPSDSDAVTGELLYSQNENPNLPQISRFWDGSKGSSHALFGSWSRQKNKYDMFVEARDIGDEFRADLGFVPQVGYREVDGAFALRYYPEHSGIRFVRPQVFVDHQTDRGGRTIFRRIAPSIFVTGSKNLAAQLGLRIKEQVRTTSALFDQTYAFFFLQFDPSRRFPRITFQGTTGEQIDFANERQGRGTRLSLAATLRPHDKITIEPNFSREWLSQGGARVYTADVQRIKTTYSFSAKSLLRVIGQYVTTDRNTGLYRDPVGAHDGSFLASVLYSYKLNWQTVLFVGYGDDRELTPRNTLGTLDRSLFFKVSYAFLR